MISSKFDLKYYLDEDKKALGITAKKPCKFGADVWKFEISLRYKEYYTNVKKRGIITQILRKYWSLRFYKYSIRLGFDIPVNVFGPGLNIHHYGCIVVSADAKVGKNCNIQQHVTIGAGSSGNSAKIGDDVFIGTGAKIIGSVTIAAGCKIGANAVVTKDCLIPNSVLVGIPAKILNKNNREN